MIHAPPAEHDGKRPLWKKLRVSLASLAVLFVVAELGTRVATWLYHDQNPYYLFYGFVSWTDEQGEGHSDKRDGYFKFPPNRRIEYGLPGGGRINNHGFRGADFAAGKPAGVFRVVCLGGSSTFGYYDPDDGTYPHLLAQRFAAEPAARPVEVLNLGVPHMNTSHVRALLVGEVLDYGPDAITLYTGYNDATFPVAESGLQRLTRWVDEHSAAFAGFRKVLNARAGPVIFGQWNEYRTRVPREEVERQLELHLEMTGDNLRAIVEEARARGIQVIFIRQAMSALDDRHERALQGRPFPTYAEEYRQAAEELEREGSLDGALVPLYIHHHLTELQARLADEYGLTLVDNVELVDEHPESLLTFVHLSPEANGRLAERLAETLRPRIR